VSTTWAALLKPGAVVWHGSDATSATLTTSRLDLASAEATCGFDHAFHRLIAAEFTLGWLRMPLSPQAPSLRRGLFLWVDGVLTVRPAWLQGKSANNAFWMERGMEEGSASRN